MAVVFVAAVGSGCGELHFFENILSNKTDQQLSFELFYRFISKETKKLEWS